MRHFRAPALKCLKHLWPAKDGAEVVFVYGHGVVKTDFSQRAPALVVECTRGTVLNTPLVLLMRIIFLIKRERVLFNKENRVLLWYLQITVSRSFVPIRRLRSPEVIDEIHIYLITYLVKYET